MHPKPKFLSVRVSTQSVRETVAILAAVSIYIAVYYTTYAVFVAPLWSGFGLGLREDLTALEVIILFTIALLPAMLLPKKLNKPSAFLIMLQYFLVYIPAVWVALNSTRPLLDREQGWWLILALASGMIIILVGYHILGVKRISPFQLNNNSYLVVLWIIYGLSIGYLAFIFRDHLQIVSLYQIYELRSRASELTLERGPLAGYVSNWLSGAVLPIMLAMAVINRSWLHAVCGVFGYFFLYSIWGSKAVLLAPLAFLAIAWFIRDSKKPLPTKFVFLFVSLLMLPVLWSIIPIGANLHQSVMEWIIHIFHQRTFSSSALLISQYRDFFDNNPYTYGSHASGFNLLFQYPFKTSLPIEVGLYTYGTSATANANFWAADGISSLGLIGLPIASIFVVLVFWVLDSCSEGLNPKFICLGLVFIGMNFCDTSIFTVIVTGGLGLFCLLIAIMPRAVAAKQHAA